MCRASASRLKQFRAAILAWYSINGRDLPWRRSGQSAFRMIVCELLLQRTRAETVAKAYRAFFSRFSSWSKMVDAGVMKLGEALKPLGLWRRRAFTMFELALMMRAKRGNWPERRDEIELLPGVGQYIANAIELIRWGRPRPLIDGNMARVLERYFRERRLADIRYDPYLQGLAHQIVQCENPLAINWAILDLAAIICTPDRPSCLECPLRRGCRFGRRLSARMLDWNAE